jgi:UDP-N-acetylmuramyl pentapeptide synthase
MEVEGKTIKEVIQKLLQEINKNVEGRNFQENFSTKFEVKGKNMKEVIENFAKKITDYFEKKKAIFENLEAEIIPGKKWILRFSLSGKIFESITKKFKEIRVLELEETIEGWKLSFSME